MMQNSINMPDTTWIELANFDLFIYHPTRESLFGANEPTV